MADRMRIVEEDAFARLQRLLKNKVVKGGPKKLAKDSKITQDYLDGLNRYDWFDIRLADDEASRQMESTQGQSGSKTHRV